MPTHRAGPYEIQVIRHESVGEPSALVTVYRRKAFVEMAVVPVEGLDVAGLKRMVLSLRGCRASELGAVVRAAKKVAGRLARSGPAN
ncbi:MAG: hypothetical protein L6R28_04190 [Planctomycetes bacterium]|nr:hypothetical protein [Planctomycetota bacterium]